MAKTTKGKAMAKKYEKTSSSKDKNGGKFENYSNGEDKVTIYTSKTGKTAVFIDGEKVNKVKS